MPTKWPTNPLQLFLSKSTKRITKITETNLEDLVNMAVHLKLCIEINKTTSKEHTHGYYHNCLTIFSHLEPLIPEVLSTFPCRFSWSLWIWRSKSLKWQWLCVLGNVSQMRALSVMRIEHLFLKYTSW